MSTVLRKKTKMLAKNNDKFNPVKIKSHTAQKIFVYETWSIIYLYATFFNDICLCSIFC